MLASIHYVPSATNCCSWLVASAFGSRNVSVISSVVLTITIVSRVDPKVLRGGGIDLPGAGFHIYWHSSVAVVSTDRLD